MVFKSFKIDADGKPNTERIEQSNTGLLGGSPIRGARVVKKNGGRRPSACGDL